MVRVAIFINKSVDELEDAINDWLEEKFIRPEDIVSIKQTESDSCWTISIWYKVRSS